MYQPQDANGRSEMIASPSDDIPSRHYQIRQQWRPAKSHLAVRVTTTVTSIFFHLSFPPPPCVINFFDNPSIADLLPVAFKFPRLNPSNPYRSNSFSLPSFLSFLISIRPISRVPFSQYNSIL